MAPTLKPVWNCKGKFFEGAEMSFDYTTNPTGKFRIAGSVIKALNGYKAAAATTYPNDLAAITGAFNAASQSSLATGLYSNYSGWIGGIRSIRTTLAKYVDSVFKSSDSLAAMGIISSSGLQAALFNRMVLDSQTVQANTVTVGTATAGGGNVGSGILLLTGTLDGVQAPDNGCAPNPGYAGRASELAVSETMAFTATSATAMRWQGGPSQPTLSEQPEGSGSGPSIPVCVGDSNTKLTNGPLDAWGNATTPSVWTTTGTVAQENTIVLRPGSSLKVAAGNTGTIVQPLSRGVYPLRAYCLSAWVKASGTGGTGNVTFGLTGTGLTLLAGSTVTQAVSGLTTAWTLLHMFVVLPAALPPDLALSWSADPGTVAVYVDEIKVMDVRYFGGLGACAVAGGVDFVPGDLVTAAITNSNAGVFQTFWRQWYGAQLPSVGSSPTISDSLAS